MKTGIDQDALVTMFAEASARQGETLRKAVSDATLKALQGREMTLDAVRKVVKTVAGAASLGAQQNPRLQPADVEAMLGKALAGIDQALLQAVEANRTALERFVEQGVAMSAKPMKDALANVEKMEDAFFGAVAKAGQQAGPMQAPWDQALAAFKVKGSDTGARAAETVQELMQQAQTALREHRASSLRAAETMLQSYGALVSGVLIGMSEGMRAGGSGGGASASSGAQADRGGTGSTAASEGASTRTAAAPRKRAARKTSR